MNLKFIRKGIVIITLVSSVLIPVQQIVAAEETVLLNLVKQQSTIEVEEMGLVNAVAEIQRQENTEKLMKIESSEEINFNDKMYSKVFAEVTEEYLLVVGAPEEDSDWVGKVFDTSVVKILQRGDIWCKIESGNVVGYIKTDSLIIGKEAVTRAKTILEEVYLEKNIFTLTDEEIEAAFTVSESREEEEARLAAEEAARLAEEQARLAAEEAARRQKGVDLVNYAEQFIGNPYVWGGTSLTKGADCSGFVQSVYAHFGVSLPRSSYSMRKVGYSVSYSEIQPGDIICYSGHVGIYAGDGQIVNAISDSKGIGLSNAKYNSIITIRRIF